jgi:CRISPR-associated protein Csm2
MANQRKKQFQGSNRQQGPTIDLGKIKLTDIGADLFDGVAKESAHSIASDRRTNKPTQLRKFYDEIIMWDTRINSQADAEKRNELFKDSLPFIRMMNAKVAYAKGRRLVDENYVKLMNHCLNEVKSPETMRNFKLFIEAFMGFYKVERPRD